MELGIGADARIVCVITPPAVEDTSVVQACLEAVPWFIRIDMRQLMPCEANAKEALTDKTLLHMLILNMNLYSGAGAAEFRVFAGRGRGGVESGVRS
ncbi:hypothetical protein Ciccas_013296 [Cichlidogyrus casuarinus]|uniref:Uncharacterized protein n=1 Tax=Cichlidogyrus casuarinus TaxID=1844966 RepID=A0ABD2PKY8_9PLAT